MTRVLLVEASPWPQGYSSGDVRVAWAPGEVREVEDPIASYLTSTFPDVFVIQREVPPVARQPEPAVEPEAKSRKRSR